MTRILVTALILALTVLAGSPRAETDRLADGQWFHDFLQLNVAHQISSGESRTVALIDSGVEYRHPDLMGSIQPGADFTEASTDGRTDIDGHGTAMAGLICAHGRAKGVAPLSTVHTIRISNTEAPSSLAAIALGVAWAISLDPDVISISAGVNTNDLLLRQEIERAIRNDIVVVAAAGNRPRDHEVVFPAAIPGVVAVAGVDRSGNRSAISVAGPEVVIAAPSDSISSTGLNGGYWEGTGTSIATAIVAGAVALVRSRFPDMKAPEVIRRLTATAVDKGAPGRDPEYGYGVLDIVAALTADLPPTTAAAASPSQGVAHPPSADDGRRWWRVIGFAVGAAIVGLLARMWWRRRIGEA